MAITFLQEKKKQKHLLLVLIIAVLMIFAIFWSKFFIEQKPVFVPAPVKPPEVKINFEVLKSPALKELQPYEAIISLEEEAEAKGEKVKLGRENPFFSYETKTEAEVETER